MYPLVYRNSRRLHTGLMAVVLVALTAGGAAAGDWSGTQATSDGVPLMQNPNTPIDAAESLSPNELWRRGGYDDEDVLFGVLTQIDADDDGTIYLLDAQLGEVMVFDAEGNYLRSIGREGEGPGEFRRPQGMFLTADGNVAVLQGMPGKIVLLSPEGDPLGEHPVPPAPDDGTQFFSDGGRAGENLFLGMNRFARNDAGFRITRLFAIVGGDGHVVETLFEETQNRDFANMQFDEKKMNNFVWAASSDGRVFTSTDFDAYRFRVYRADGSLDRVVERRYQHRKRTPEEMERNKPRIRFRRRGGADHQPETIASPTDRDIVAMQARDDGTLWVLGSHGAFDAPEGAIATFDVFDRDGRFARQVTIEGEGRFPEDGVHFVGERLYVVRGLRSARSAMMGGDEETEADSDEEPEPMSVICYDLGRIVQGRN